MDFMRLNSNTKNMGGPNNDIGLINAFNKIKTELWETWENGIISKTFSAGPSYFVIGYKHSDVYGALIIVGYYSARPTYNYCIDGKWGTLISI